MALPTHRGDMRLLSLETWWEDPADEVVGSQIPSISLAAYGAGMANASPLYLVVVLHRLLGVPDVSGDPNMGYAERLIAGTLSV